ncbi:DEAD/DEAH box helicase [Fontisubflavum oceani]|uniref:DEAD/DEAH box helicase n=1 Tax=Fontisubflavum oceani TaxID=2978973 RepID=UPI0025B46E62|nr:DEAD/DEAH box helicase [Fontisubflavum oceani]WJY21578.1 DEAD/DEAH box helicase [Fontisubflavum oceani]
MDKSITVDYDSKQRFAKVEVFGPASAWRAVRRICQDSFADANITSKQSVSIPWWSFLGCLNEIEYQARRFDLPLRYTDAAAEHLAHSQQAIDQYDQARLGIAQSEKDVAENLRKTGFVRSLTHHQLRNVTRIISLPSAATFSVPGAGKTTEALAYFALKKAADDRLMVVCPKNAFAAWEEQLAICMPEEEQFVRLRGGKRNISIILKQNPSKVLVTYQQLPHVLSLLANYIETGTSFVFLDESHRIKRGFQGVIGNNILSISQLPRNKLIMSGTPMPNDVSDLVPQFRFLYPEILADEESVEQYIQPVYVRTTKSELGLESPIKTIKRIPLKPAQFELYQLLRSEAARQSKANLSRADIGTLRRAGKSALRLLQVAANPSLLARLDFQYDTLLSEVLSEGDSPKLEYACYRARELAFEGHKSIIWSSFVQNVELVSNRLVDIGADYIHGGVDAGSEDEEGTREQKIKRFHDDPDCWVLVANPAACGEGISLHTVCHHAIYLDRNYNAAQYLQSEDRIHRLGLPPEQDTFVEILQSPGTIDESVDRRLTLKIEHMARVLDDPSINVEPEVIDLDADGFDEKDLIDFYSHLSEQVA